MTKKRIQIFVPGRPIPQPRMTRKQRFLPQFAHHAVWGWRELVAWSVKARRDDSWPIRRRVALGLRFLVYPGQEGDLDNYIKAVKDCLNGVLYVDDRQVREFLSPTLVEEETGLGRQGLHLAIEYDQEGGE